jgi:D-3-phosphoglycerate dehydrogenase
MKLIPRPSKLRTAGFEVTEDFDITPEELKAAIKDYDVLVVRSRTKVTKDIIAAGSKLKLIGRVGVGVDNIDAKAAEAARIKVVNTPQMSTVAVAELVMTMMLCLVRPVHLANESTKKGLWEKKKFRGSDSTERFWAWSASGGSAGRCERAKAFNMSILVYDVVVDEVP